MNKRSCEKRGVSYRRYDGVYLVQIKIDRRTIYLGTKRDEEEAYQLFFDTYLEFYGEEPW